MDRPAHMTVDTCVRAPAICDFDELMGDYHPFLREVVALLPVRKIGDHTERRAKFLALREWITLSSAFDIPCYFCKQEEGDDEPATLWIKVIDSWISETHIETGLFRGDDAGPQKALPYPVLEDPLMRRLINLWLIQIEHAFQTWWQESAHACLVIQTRGDDGGMEDVTRHVLSLPIDLRTNAIARNIWPDGGSGMSGGKIFLYKPSNSLVAWRQSQKDAEKLNDRTRIIASEAQIKRL